MTHHDCTDRVRFSLNDSSGTLRFEAFDIVDEPKCRDVADRLREILLSRPLVEIDVAEIRRMACPGGSVCMNAVAKVIEECQTMFARKR